MKKNKFRVWDGDKFHYTPKFNMHFSKSGIIAGLLDGGMVFNNDNEISQYIGLEDLNNKEAYENDLIRYKYYHEDGKKVTGIGKIYFDGGCYFLEDVKTKYKYPMYLASLSFEIVGDIYQNKDLL